MAMILNLITFLLFFPFPLCLIELPFIEEKETDATCHKKLNRIHVYWISPFFSVPMEVLFLETGTTFTQLI